MGIHYSTISIAVTRHITELHKLMFQQAQDSNIQILSRVHMYTELVLDLNLNLSTPCQFPVYLDHHPARLVSLYSKSSLQCRPPLLLHSPVILLTLYRPPKSDWLRVFPVLSFLLPPHFVSTLLLFTSPLYLPLLPTQDKPQFFSLIFPLPHTIILFYLFPSLLFCHAIHFFLINSPHLPHLTAFSQSPLQSPPRASFNTQKSMICMMLNPNLSATPGAFTCLVMNNIYTIALMLA